MSTHMMSLATSPIVYSRIKSCRLWRCHMGLVFAGHEVPATWTLRSCMDSRCWVLESWWCIPRGMEIRLAQLNVWFGLSHWCTNFNLFGSLSEVVHYTYALHPSMFMAFSTSFPRYLWRYPALPPWISRPRQLLIDRFCVQSPETLERLRHVYAESRLALRPSRWSVGIGEDVLNKAWRVMKCYMLKGSHSDESYMKIEWFMKPRDFALTFRGPPFFVRTWPSIWTEYFWPLWFCDSFFEQISKNRSSRTEG